MAKKAAKKAHKGKKHHPTAKAKAAYNKLIVKSYRRLHGVLKKHNPGALLGKGE